MKGQRKRWMIALLLLAVALCAGGLSSASANRVALAQSGGDYDLSWHVVGSGGGAMADGASYQLNGTVGQSGVGTGLATGGSYQVAPGFWYGVNVGYRVYLPLILREV